MRGNHDYGISRFNGIFTARGNDLPAAVDAGNQKVILKGKLLKRDSDERRILADTELQSLCLVLNDLVEGFHVASHGILHSTDIADDAVRGDHFRINDAAEIHLLDDVLKSNTVDLGHELGI